MNTGFVIAGMAVAMALAGVSGASATTEWQAHHMRRAEVNHRLARQNHRITVERRDGELTASQAHALRAEDRRIRAEERFGASRNHGHITAAEQHRLNRQENAVSRQIGR